MELLSQPDWAALFAFETPLLEIFIRGTIIYISLLCLLRFVLKRQAGTIGLGDLLVIVLIADAAQNGMAGDYHTITDGLLLVATLMFWNYMFEWLGQHFPAFERVMHPAPVPLIKNGRMHRKNMESELISEDELMSVLRQQGIDRVKQVKRACLEGDGRISVIKYPDGKEAPPPRKRAV